MIDFCITTDATLLTHNVDNVLQQIDMLFDTDYNEVLGDDVYGSDYRKFLYNTMLSNSSIEEYARMNITRNVDLLGYTLDVKAKVYMGTVNDIILLTVTLSNGTESYEKVYNIG